MKEALRKAPTKDREQIREAYEEALEWINNKDNADNDLLSLFLLRPDEQDEE